MAVTAQQIGREVLQALGLEGKSVTGIKIEMNGRDPVTLEVSMLPERSQVVSIIEIIKRYELVEKPE